MSDSGDGILMGGSGFLILLTGGCCRVEKYRPDTFEDVSGHQDVLATINKFVECNVRLFLECWNYQC